MLLITSLLALVLAVVFWRRPHDFLWGTMGTAVLVEVIHHWYPGIGQYFPFLGVVAGTLLGLWPERREFLGFVARHMRVIALFILYAVVVAVSTVTSQDIVVSIRYAAGIPVVLFFTVVLVPYGFTKGWHTQETLLRMMVVFGVVFAGASGIGALVFHQGFVVPVGSHHLLAWQWPFINKNTLGMLLTFAAPAAFGFMLAPHRTFSSRLLWGGSTGLILVATVLSYSRSAWIAVLVGLGAIIVTRFGRRGIILFAGAAPVLAIIAVLATGLKKWESLWAHGLSGRLVLWQAAVKVIQQHPWFGVGPGNSPMAITPLIPHAYAGLTPSDTILRTSVELGVFGVILWTILVGGALLRFAMAQSEWRWPGYILGSVGLASLAQQMVESTMLGGVSFGDYFFTVIISVGWINYHWAVRRSRRRTNPSLAMNE